MMSAHYLTSLFEPRSVAIVGATERSSAIGHVLIENMVDARFKGQLYAVNPKHRSVLGVRCYASVDKLPDRADLAVIATPPAAVAAVIADCGRAGIKSA